MFSVKLFVFCRYCIMKMFGENLSMFCSPQPVGSASNDSKPVRVGPITSPGRKNKEHIGTVTLETFKQQHPSQLSIGALSV